MSEDEFHVHGAHEHEIEHRAHAGDAMASRVAVATAILATIGAVFALQGGSTQNEALLDKNDAAIKRAEASDQWSFYQAKSGKQNLAELGAELATGDAQERFRQEAARYAKEKAEIEPKARALEEAAAEANRRSDEASHAHHRWAQATTLVQIAIALAAITLLTRRRWLQYIAYAAGAGGIVLGAIAMLQH
jgi:Domain of unknown function (DUF4337)